LNNGTQLAVIGFSRVSERQIILYSSDDIAKEIASHGIDVNPAILIPFYDEGSSTLFLAGKGDTTVFAFEISPTADGEPHIHALSNFNCPSPHQAVAFLPKICCDVKAVEFAKGYRLTDSTIEPVSVTVPRLRAEFFQDDIFPKQRVTWEPSLTAAQWFSGKDAQATLFDLRPPGMENLSNAPAPPQTPKKPSGQQAEEIRFEGSTRLKSSLAFLNVGRNQTDNLVNSMSRQINIIDGEPKRKNSNANSGVDDNEWDDSE
jgi:coronin-7